MTDTTDLRAGVPLSDELLAVLPLVGKWAGRGIGVVASTGAGFAFRQHVTFAHDGRPFLAYESRSWLIDDDDRDIRPAFRESGFWRPGAGPDDLEVLTVSITGLAQLFVGTAGDGRWEIATTSIVGTPTAKQVAGERRLYAISGDTLAYATELALTPDEYTPHLNATLQRVKAMR
ncbi:MAG TPA: FABP family protein [Jatrophihabitantaceae bacterium]|nr:FABP family protein [Jatrophihabitantaceae bacterium]